MRTKLKITEGIFPMPVLMVATYNEDGSVNVMNAAWGTMHYDTEDIPAILAVTAAENVMVDGKIDMSKVNTIALS